MGKYQETSAYKLLRQRFPENEYCLICEVSDSTGFRDRSLDFMLINYWASRGLAITGIERKSWRNDWLKELKNPAKQERHYQYCDYFYLLTDKEGVAKIDEIPRTWGWFHITQDGRLNIMKQAPQLKPKPVHRGLMCAMLRRAAAKEGFIHVDMVEDRIKQESESIANERKTKSENALNELNELKERIQTFENITGLKLQCPYEYGWDIKKYSDAVKLVADGGIDDIVKKLERYINSLTELKKEAAAKMKKLKVK